MAPGLNGRQTGTVPKNKSKNSGSHSQRLAQESFVLLPSLDWERMPGLGNQNRSLNKSGSVLSETETDSIRHDTGRSRSSTMTSQVENGEGCSQDSLSSKVNLPDKKQVVTKLSQIQNYIQQTAALMNALKVSESPHQKSQYEKLSLMMEDLKDSEAKLSKLLNNMDNTESRIDSILTGLERLQPSSKNRSSRRMQKFNQIVNENFGPITYVTNSEGKMPVDEEELVKRSEESKKKLEVLQKRKQDLLKLQEKAKKQLYEAQAEQSRLVARASSLNQELNTIKTSDLNVQQLSQKLKAVQQIHNASNQISNSLDENQRTNGNEAEHHDEQTESDTETEFQLVANKMEELKAMKVQLGQIQKIMASINGIPHVGAPNSREPSGEFKELTNHNLQHSNEEDGNNNIMQIEQAKTKLNHLTQLLEIVQSAQNTTAISPYLQLVSNLANDENESVSPSPSPEESAKSLERSSEELSAETMQVMTRELEETTAAMKEEHDRLLAARQELQDIARRLPINKTEKESLFTDDEVESERPCLKLAAIDSNPRETLNGFLVTEAEQSSNCNDESPYLGRTGSTKSRSRGTWNASLSDSNCTTQEKRCKNGSLSRGSNQSSRGGSRGVGRDHSRWSPSPGSYCNERTNPVTQTQGQLEMSSQLCELMLSDSLQRGARDSGISLQEMFSQHQLLTRTVAQCSQLLWLQQKQIIELRNVLMLQCGAFPNLQLQQISSNQGSTNFSLLGNSSFLGMSGVTPFSNPIQIPSATVQEHQNYNPANQNLKMNTGGIQNIQIPQHEFPELFLHQGNQTSMHFTGPESFGYEIRPGNFNRYNLSISNANQNVNQNVSAACNNRVPNAMNCIGPEDTGALNNQVPPGNRANNYWDNFRSYSRQNLLSTTKSNEDSESTRRSLALSSQDRPPRDLFIPPSPHNNQSAAGTSYQTAFACGNPESTTVDHHLLPPSQNTRVNHHSQVTRSRSVEPQNHRNPGKNESRSQDNESRNLNVTCKNESGCSSRARNSDSVSDNIRNVRNDVSQTSRNVDNLNSTRNFIQLVRDFDNEEVPQGNNKKRLERTRCRNDGIGVLNNRGYHNSSLWDNISLQVSSFLRANEMRPHFLLQLFRDLQQLTTDSLRQRTLECIQEAVNANNLTERTSNMTGGNVNIIDNRNNIRESRSNLNRNQAEDPTRIDELFFHLRENQNTIRQNIGMSSFVLGGNNLENPNISNIRDLGNPRNNLENEGLRDLKTYFEANLCNFGHHSTLENPNLSNIRENLTRRGAGSSDFENVNPKNVFLSIYDNAAVESRRRNQESAVSDFEASFRNYEIENDYMRNEFPQNSDPLRMSNNQFELGHVYEDGAVGRSLFQQGRVATPRFSIVEAGDNFARSRQFLGNGNDSGIDVNYNNEEQKQGFVAGSVENGSNGVKSKKNEEIEIDGAAVLLSQWERNDPRDASFDSALSVSRNDAASPFVPICENSFLNCRTFRQSDNEDLAEADQSRNEETSGAESDSGFINAQIPEPENRRGNSSFSPSGNDFSGQNIPESERNFVKGLKREEDLDGVAAAVAVTEPETNGNFLNCASEPEGNFTWLKDSEVMIRKNDGSEGYHYPVNATSSSDNSVPKSGVKPKKRMEDKETFGNSKRSASKNSTNKFRDCSFDQGKFNGLVHENFENIKTDSDSVASTADVRQKNGSRDSLYFGAFQLALEKSEETEKGNTSPEADSDWECGSGLDQVPTRLDKNGKLVILSELRGVRFVEVRS